jgi:hypothetical protein
VKIFEAGDKIRQGEQVFLLDGKVYPVRCTHVGWFPVYKGEGLSAYRCEHPWGHDGDHANGSGTWGANGNLNDDEFMDT